MLTELTKTEKRLLAVVIFLVLVWCAGMVLHLEFLSWIAIMMGALMGTIVMADFDPIYGSSLPFFDRKEIRHPKLWLTIIWAGALLTGITYYWDVNPF